MIFIPKGASLEKQVNVFVEQVMAPRGFALEKIAKMPYLCEGDIKKPYYVLQNVAMVFKPV